MTGLAELEEIIENDYGPAFAITTSQFDRSITVWFEQSETSETWTRGRKLSPDEAREMASALEELAQEADPVKGGGA